MTDINAVDGAKVLEQISANTERAIVLAKEGNTEALAALKEETETLISSLSGKGSIKAKKEARDAWAAAEATPAESAAEVVRVTTGTVVEKTWDQYEGVPELVNIAAEKLAEGVRAHLKTSHVAKDVAAVVFDMWTRIPNKAGTPDLMGDSDAAKKASREMLRLAGQGFEDTWDNAQALRKLTRSIQDFRSDVRAEWLRSLDQDDETGNERRALVTGVLEGKPDDVAASQWVADVYGTSTVGQAERKRLDYQAKKEARELAAGASTREAITTGGGESDSEEAEPEPTTTPDERVRATVKRLVRDLGSAKPEDFESASDDTKEAVRKELEEASKALKLMIAATL